MRKLYYYDFGDDSPDDWGESPEAYMKRMWLESRQYLVEVEPCEHGNVYRHPVVFEAHGHNERDSILGWCEGGGGSDE